MSVSQRIVGSLAAAAALVMLPAMSQAAVFPDFQVTEGSVAGSSANTFTADKIVGGYNEVITFDTNNGTFTVSLLWNAGQYFANDGATQISPVQLNGFGTGGYQMYALYQGSGTFSTSGSVTTFTTTPGVGSLSVYIDPDSNTTFNPANFPASGSIAFAPDAGTNTSDYLIATGTPLSGMGQLDPSLGTCGSGGINCGSFGTSTSFPLTAAGSNYFTLPIPFYNLSFQSGQLNNFSPSGTQTINGSMDVVFSQVPEPASLALVGVALLGCAGVSRRRRQR